MAKDVETSKPKHLDPTSEYYLSNQENSELSSRGSPAMSHNTIGSSSGPLQASAAATQNNNPSLSQAQATATSVLLGLTSEQMQCLITFLESSPSGTDSLVATKANCFVAFSYDICVLQDRTSKSPIRLGKMHRGVFMFQPLFTATMAAVSESESYELWHWRMGHPSSKPLIHLPTVSIVSPSLKLFVMCLCYAPTKFADKFAPRSRRCVFLGYPPGKKGWRVYDLETNQVLFSRDVKFEKTVFPFTTPLGPLPTPATTTFCPAWDCAEHPMASPPSHVDHTLFTYRKGDVFLSVLVYVDDLILAGNNNTAYSLFKKYLNDDCFKLKDLGPLKYFWASKQHVDRVASFLSLSQCKYALDILFESGLSASKPVAFPME
ncbi:hypothetical protein RJ639_005233 [Escallonia herrerae]|uniref:GAG-pre-integrase domain-containing protein n=1 Tax=Escallonia herrerae TaxID=1293975 RepID=A0AA89AV11_9ASTE|nr:hypothetical protein RJ639_005233 [Escallonia herrerae]